MVDVTKEMFGNINEGHVLRHQRVAQNVDLELNHVQAGNRSLNMLLSNPFNSSLAICNHRIEGMIAIVIETGSLFLVLCVDVHCPCRERERR